MWSIVKYCIPVLLFTGFAAGCRNERSGQLSKLNMPTLSGTPVSLNKEMGSIATVYLFLSPDCPMCISSSGDIRELAESYSSQGISFLTVYPGTFYTISEIDSFHLHYNIGLPAILDTALVLTKLLEATVTPEVVVLSPEYETLYSGAINERAASLGKKRQLVGEHYLKKVLDAILSEQALPFKRVNPVGCFIES
jgi:hypothetical protein